jgi:nucleoside-diphosphate-sugar epimerase
MVKTYFITGSEVFIGSHLVEKLVSQGHKVRSLVLYNSYGDIGSLKFINRKNNNVKIIFGDIRDRKSYENCLIGVDAIIHLASLISIPYSYIAAKSYFETNVIGLLNLLEASIEKKVPRFINTSTSEVYGTAETKLINETHSLKAQSPYAASKISADKLFESYVCSHGINGLTIRPFNSFGPRQSFRAIIPTIISQLLSENYKMELGNINR